MSRPFMGLPVKGIISPAPRVTVGLDYADTVVRLCVLDAQGRPLCNRDVANDAGAIALYDALAGKSLPNPAHGGIIVSP